MKKVMYFMAAAALTVLASCGNTGKAGDSANNSDSANDTAAVKTTEAAAIPQVNADELLASRTVEAITENITLEQCLSLSEQLKQWSNESENALRDQASKADKAKAVEEAVNAHPFMARAYNVLKAVMDSQDLCKKLGIKGETYQKLYKATQAYGAFVRTAEFQDAGAPLQNLADYQKL